MVMPGADAGSHDMSWLKVPVGFCAHYFANVPHTRQLRVASNGDVYAASPSTPTAGGSGGTGLGSVVVLPDDDHDGVSDKTLTYLSVVAVQGMTLHDDHLYYQDGMTLRRVPFSASMRAPAGAPETVATLDATVAQQATEHWPKNVDFAMDGTMYVTNGSSQGETCISTARPFGAVFSVPPGATPITPVAWGFRNPIALRCEPDHDVCLAAELALDGSGDVGREKIVPVRNGDNWGFPCCATQGVPYTGAKYSDTGKVPDCSGVTPEVDSFVVGHTPFGIDFETGTWPAPWTKRAFVTLHGYVGSWIGARVVGISLDPASGLPLPATDRGGDSGTGTDTMLDLATGWDTGKQEHGRPAAIAFAPDGRMFIGNDWNGDIVWIAPISLPGP
jgi:glucose/arabinose dehydrogenase